MFFNILGNVPRPLACAAQGCPVSCPGRELPWKYLRQRSAPRVTARRCPMRRTPSRRRQFEGRPLARSAQPWTGGRLLVGAQQCMYERSCFLSGVTRRCRACSSILQRPACVRLLGSRGCSVLPSTSRDHVLLDFWTEWLAGSGRLRADDAVA